MRLHSIITGTAVLLISEMVAAADIADTAAVNTVHNLIVNGDFQRVDLNGRPIGWGLQSFRGHPTPTISVEPDAEIAGNAASLKFDGGAAVGQGLSFFGRLPELDTTRKARVSFKYKLSGTTPFGNPSYSISAGPGNLPPSGRTWFSPLADSRWHVVSTEIPLQGLKPVGSVMEFSFNDLGDTNQTLSLAEMKLIYLEDARQAALSFKLPISGVLFADDPNQTVSGAVKTWRQYAGNKIRLKLSSSGAPDQVLQSQEITAAISKAAWQMDLSGLPVGQYHVTAELLGPKGAVTATSQETLSKVVPSLAIPRIVKGTTYYQGKPFLPIGLVHVADWVLEIFNADSQSIGASAVTREEMLSSIKARGFNTVLLHGGDTPEFIGACLQHNLMPLPTAAPKEMSKATLREHVGTHKKTPNLLGWYGVDEPILGPRMDRALDVYRSLKQWDPHRVVWACAYMSSPVTALDYEGTFADAILVDRYEVRSPTSDLSALGDCVRAVAQYADANPGLLVGVAPQTFTYLGSEPTVEQLRAQTYLGVVNGAKAFLFYAYAENFAGRFTDDKNKHPLTPDGMSKNPKRAKWWLSESVLWDAFPELNCELRQLEEFILHDGETIHVRTDASKIQFIAKKLPDQTYFIAVNPTAQTQTASFSFPSSVTLRGVFHTPQVSPSTATINLNFRGYEVKVFKLTKPD